MKRLTHILIPTVFFPQGIAL